MLKRVRQLRQLIDQSGVEAFLVTGMDNIRYLSGFTGSSGVLLVSAGEALLLTDSRYTIQAHAEVSAFEIVTVEKTWLSLLAKLLKDRDYQTLGLEGEQVTYQQFLRLQEALITVKLKPLKGVVEGLRLVKDEDEIKAIRRAVALVDEAFAALLSYARAGRTEQEITLELEFNLRNRGAERMSFETIVASGARSALPHGRASGKVLENGDLVVLDCGVVLDGYCSDFTRTLLVGTAPAAWQEEIYGVVLAAQDAAIKAIRAGVRAVDVDASARKIIEDQGYGEYFGHGTGHGLGLDVHELPHLNRFSEETLQAGMVVTVEPGIYLPDRGGVRIEDVVVVRENEAEILTETPKERLFMI